MTRSVLILGARGKFGRNASAAFQHAGWSVRHFDRANGDLRREVDAADVVINGWNPPDYTTWSRDLMRLHQTVIAALQGTGRTVLLPGNVYVFGANTPGPWSETSAHAASNPLGRLRIDVEDAYRTSGIQTIVLRAGDFIDTAPSGNWFDLVLTAKMHRGRFTYPGRPDIPHAWAYLPDLARAAVALAERRLDLPQFVDVPFEGYTLTGAEMMAVLSELTGKELRLARFPWPLLRVAQVAVPNFRSLREMSYLWATPHRLDGARLEAHVPGFEPTPLPRALARAIAHTRLVLSARDVDPNQPVAVHG